MAKQFLRFLSAGGLSTLAHWLLMAILIWNGCQATLATTLGACLGAVCNYALQYWMTFHCREQHRKTLLTYGVTVLLSTTLNSLLFHALHEAADVSAPAAQGLTTAVIACLNFLLYRKVVFHERRKQSLATTVEFFRAG